VIALQINKSFSTKFALIVEMCMAQQLGHFTRNSRTASGPLPTFTISAANGGKEPIRASLQPFPKQYKLA
jgi:hypothetical protein